MSELIDQHRKHNWKTISAFLKGRLGYSHREDLKFAKEIYFGDRSLDETRSVIERLMFAPKIDAEVLATAENGLRNESDKSSLFKKLEKVQRDYGFYFGKNSLFGRQEKCIYDHFQFVESSAHLNSIRERRNQEPFSTVAEYLYSGNMWHYILKHSVGDHIQTWRNVIPWEVQVKSAPQEIPLGEIPESTKHRLLAVEIANQNEDRFDDNIAILSKKIRCALTDGDTPKSIRAAYENLVDAELESFTLKSCIGSKMTVCIQYESMSQVEAIIEQMNPSARWPFCGEQDDRKIHHLQFRNGEIRTSVGMLHRMWESGISFNSHRIEDNNMLIVNLNCSAFRYRTLEGLSSLLFDATDIVKRYKSKKSLPGDKCISESRVFNSAIVFETISGEWAVTCSELKVSIAVKDCSWVDKLAIGSDTPEKLAIKLTSKKYYEKLISELIIADKERGMRGYY